MKRKVLILGSGEGLAYAEKLQSLLMERISNMNLDYDCLLWSNSMVWETGEVTLTSLIHKAQELKSENGFAITLFTPDDVVKLRGKSLYSSRDNVWLEYGLFVGIMGRNRVFTVCPNENVEKEGKKKKWHKPSDFQQYELRYDYKDIVDEAKIDIANIAIQIADRINQKKPNTSFPHSNNEISEPEFKRSY